MIQAPSIDFDESYTFYYDETNNIRKFHIKKSNFNANWTKNFILGGLAHKSVTPNVQPLIDNFKLQKSVTEVKFKHLANGNFLDCLNSKKINLFLNYINSNDLYIHYSSLNILYWSITDIVDSAISHSNAAQQLGLQHANKLKNDLYKLAKLEIDKVIPLFHKYKYPNIKQNNVMPFIEGLNGLFKNHLDDIEFHFSLESLRQLLKEANRKASLPLLTGEENLVLIKDFSPFYMRPIYMFKNSTHVFDNEDSIINLLSSSNMSDGLNEIKNYSFVDSESNQLIQLSDILVGFIGKLHEYLNCNTTDKIRADIEQLNSNQCDNIDLLFKLIDDSHTENMGFMHTIDCHEETSKIEIIRTIRHNHAL